MIHDNRGFKIRINKNEINIYSENYYLKYAKYYLGPVAHVRTTKGKPITARDIKYYKSYKNSGCPSDFIPEPDKVYMEIGAGFGEFVPHIISELGTELKHRPIVVDPLIYPEMIGLLEKSLEMEMDEHIIKRIKTRIERARIISNPELVNLYNITLEEALQVKELQNCADMVVDLFGGAVYQKKEDYLSKDWRELEQKHFLKKELQKL